MLYWFLTRQTEQSAWAFEARGDLGPEAERPPSWRSGAPGAQRLGLSSRARAPRLTPHNILTPAISV